MTRYGRADSKLPFPMLNFSTSVDQEKQIGSNIYFFK